MFKTVLLGMLVFSTYCFSQNVTQCIYGDSLWNTLTPAQKTTALVSPEVQYLDTACFITYLRRSSPSSQVKGDTVSLAARIVEYVNKRNIEPGTTLLSAFLEAGGPHSDLRSWKTLCGRWERKNGSFRAAAASLFEAGKIPAADSIYALFRAAGALDANDMLRWADCKGVLGRYREAAQVLCEAVRADPRSLVISLSRLAYMLRENDSTEIRIAVSSFGSCYLSLKNADTLAFRDWAAGLFERSDMPDQERRLLLSLETPRFPVCAPLLEMAGRNFAQKRYVPASAAATSAYDRAPDERTRSFCAAIVYESFRLSGMRDSALAWLGRVKGMGPDAKAAAVSLLQSSGLSDRADSLLQTIPESRVRDTLAVRSLLLRGRPDSARAMLDRCTSTPRWRSAPCESGLWTARIALFCGKPQAFRLALDSLCCDQAGEYTREIIEYRYWLARLDRNPAALADWPAFEYALYKGQPLQAEVLLHSGRYGRDAAQLFIVRLAQAFISRGDIAGAARVITSLDVSLADPEQTYVYAEILLRQGETAQAKKLLEQLILAYPRNVFSSKARIILDRQSLR